MAASSSEAINSASAASSRFPSVCSSITSEHESETIHSTFARKSHGDTGVVPVNAETSIGASISTGEQHSSDIFSLSDQQLSDKMKFVKEVGFGNWGSVWLCEPRLAEERAVYGSQIAVKLVHRSKTPTTAARVRSLWNEMKIVRALRREASASGSSQDAVGVGHPNVIQFYSFIITPSYALITMQYLPIPVPVEVPEFRAKPWFLALTDAVSFLHQRGVVHNDIKPANIILTGGPSPMPVLVDFGFAEHYTLTSRHAFQSNLAYGTPEYLAPERAKGQPHDTRKSDVYALGITFFEILVGRTPFEEVEGESFVSKEDLERYWTRTVKGKWIGKWEGIMSKPCEKALKRMVLPNADLRATALDVLADPYFKGEDETSRSNLSVDLSVLSDIIPPWSRQTLAQSRSKAKVQASIKSKQPTVTKRPILGIKAATTKAAPTADKGNVPARSETVKSRTGTLHRTSKSITEAFRKSVGTSKKAPRKTALEVFEIVTPGNAAPENPPSIKPKESVSLLKKKNSGAVLKDKNSKVLKEQGSTNILREKALKTRESVNALKEKKSAVAPKENRSATFALAPKKKEPVQDKENVKPKVHGKTFSMTMSFSRSFGRKQGKDKENEISEQPIEKRPSMYFSRKSESPATPTDSSAIAETPSAAVVSTAASRENAPAPYNPRDVRSVFNITAEPSTPTNASNPFNFTTTDGSCRIKNSSTASRSIVFSTEAEVSSAPQAASTPVNSGSVRSRQALFDRTHALETPERTPVTPARYGVASKSLVKSNPRLSTVAQSPASSTKSPSPVANKARVSKIAAKENRRTSVVARTSPVTPRGTPVKTKPSPSRVRASPAKAAASSARIRNVKAPVFTIGPKTNANPKVPAKKAPTKVLGDATNTKGSSNVKPSQKAKKVEDKRAEAHEDEGDDTITLPVEVIRSPCLSRMSKSSNTSIIKQSILQSIDKAVRFGRSSAGATEVLRSVTPEVVGRRRSLSIDEALSHQHDESMSENKENQLADWIRGIEKVVEDARQSFQVGDPTPLALPPPPPRLNHSQSAGLTRISTSAKDPTIRTIVSNVNPSVTTFAAAPQTHALNRRATVSSSIPTPPSTASSTSFNTPVAPQGRLSRPITPCLNAELGKEPTTLTSPRLCDVIDADSRRLILGQVPISESASHSRSTSYESNSGRITLSSDAQRTRFFQTPSPSHSRTHSRMTSTNSAISRPATAMSGKISAQDVEVETTEQVYENFLKTQSTVIRKGKGYQSDYTIRGKGIEHIAPGSDTESEAKQGFFVRVASPTNLVPERAFRAFKTMMSGGPKRGEPIPSANSVFVGGGFGPGSEASRSKPAASYSRSWSRAQVA
ncbi:kinase-like protein [Rhizoctonia solani]|uniref:Kinase-like protein n=1 Tax=Rhizoctonia solani TaxID=456999 RepID=A0A8H7LJ94_9AGAM|nr:kinase-like protein [Rhizoctonia solani]